MSNLIKSNFIAKVNISLLQTAEIVKMQKCYLFTHGAPRSSQELVQNMSMHSGIELKFGNVGILRSGKNRSTRRKTSQSRVENQQQLLNTHMTPGPGIETRAHWWEVSNFTTAPSLLPNCGPKWWENVGRQIMEMMSLFFLHKQSRRVEEVEKATPDVPKIKQPETKLKFWLLLLLLLSIVLLLILF